MTTSGLRSLLRGLVFDVERLLPAGGGVAMSDERLHRHAHSLRPWLDAVPGLKPLGDALGRFLSCDAETARSSFMDLFTTVRLVRPAVSDVGRPGPLEKLPRLGEWATPLNRVTVRNVLRAIKARLTWHMRNRWRATIPEHGCDMRLIDAWFARLLRHPRETAQAFFDEVVPRYGAGIAPDLRRRIDVRGKDIHCRLLQALCRVDRAAGLAVCRTALRDGSLEMKIEALGRLADLNRGEAERAARPLIGAEWPVPLRTQAVHVLHLCQGDRGDLLSLLESELTDRSAWSVCQGAMPVFLALGDAGKAFVVNMGLKGLRKGRKAQRVAVAVQLGRLGRDAEAAVPEVIKLMREVKEERYRTKVLPDVLMELGVASVPAAEALLHSVTSIVNGSQSPKRTQCVEELLDRLTTMARENPAVAATLAESCPSLPSWVRWKVLDLIGRLNEKAAPSVPVLCLLTEHPDQPVRLGAVQTLGLLNDQAAVPALRACLDDVLHAIRLAAAQSLTWLSAADDRVVSVLTETARNRGQMVHVRKEAIHALAALGPAATAALPELIAIRDRKREPFALVEAAKAAVELIE